MRYLREGIEKEIEFGERLTPIRTARLPYARVVAVRERDTLCVSRSTGLLACCRRRHRGTNVNLAPHDGSESHAGLMLTRGECNGDG